MKSLINTKKLKRLKRSLPKNGMQEIADELGISLTTVSRTFSGENRSRLQDVVEISFKIVERERLKIEELNKKIDSL